MPNKIHVNEKIYNGGGGRVGRETQGKVRGKPKKKKKKGNEPMKWTQAGQAAVIPAMRA